MAEVDQAAKKQTEQDAITLLMADHKKVKKLFRQFNKLIGKTSNNKKKASIVDQACFELTIHTQIEEELFYPAVEKILAKQALLDEAEVEHASAKYLIAQLKKMKPGDDLYDAKFTVLGEYVKHHIKEEENEMFPKVEKSTLDTAALGEKMAKRKKKLMSDKEKGSTKKSQLSDNKARDKKPVRNGRGKGNGAQRDSAYTS
jgi:hemerythrin-like domain-containing protein